MPTILLIDDDESLRQLVAEALQCHGFAVIQAPDGSVGVDSARVEMPDIIVSDINMNNVDGYAALAELRSNPRTATIPVILMTGSADLVGMRQSMRLGADDYLPKPFKLVDLVAAIEARLKRRQDWTLHAQDQMDQFRAKIMTALPHDLLTPLRLILDLSETISRDVTKLEPTELGGLVSQIHQSALRMDQLIKDFQLSAAEASSLPIQAVPASPHQERLW